jgi:putative hemolysin
VSDQSLLRTDEKASRFFRRRNAPELAAIDLSPGGEQERFIVNQLAELRTTEVREVMTARLEVVALSIPVEADAVAKAVRETGHSCFPVIVDDELDDLVGVLYVTDMFRSTRGHATAQPTSMEISKRVRDAHLIPESLTVLEALADLRRARRAFAVVVDEFGGVAGVLTVKDLLEPLVGDLTDEFDAEEEPDVLRVDRFRWLVDGRANLDVVRSIGLEIPDGDYVTFGGFLLTQFGAIPEEQATLELQGCSIKVSEMDRRRISKVLVKKHEDTAHEDNASPSE